MHVAARGGINCSVGQFSTLPSEATVYMDKYSGKTFDTAASNRSTEALCDNRFCLELPHYSGV